jgi:CHAT domain-containing protein
VLHADLGQYRYVHFATHGLVDSRSPALSALALSQFDQHGNALMGFLRLDDIYNLDLNADLVVLSACDTALGREIRGEGLVGFTQAFLYAGAKGLVLSLWQVSDAATATLMTRFYAHMIKQGTSPAEALRAAQLSMAAEPRWANPYYWGAFVLVGDAQ